MKFDEKKTYQNNGFRAYAFLGAEKNIAPTGFGRLDLSVHPKIRDIYVQYIYLSLSVNPPFLNNR